MIVLKQGDPAANGGRVSYNPQNNTSGAYYVRSTAKGGGGTYYPGPVGSGTFGGGYVARDATTRLTGSCAYEVVVGPQRGGGKIEIVNESDRGITWWCFNSEDTWEEIRHEKGDLSANGGKISYSPPSNATGAYSVLITRLGGHATYRDWAPSQSAVLGRAKVRPGETITFRGFCSYEVVAPGTATGWGFQVG
jgi:hypothetical protein